MSTILYCTENLPKGVWMLENMITTGAAMALFFVVPMIVIGLVVVIGETWKRIK